MKVLAIIFTVMAGAGLASASFTISRGPPEGVDADGYLPFMAGTLLGPFFFTILAAWAWGKCGTKPPPEKPPV
jgi:hypothetical protein